MVVAGVVIFHYYLTLLPVISYFNNKNSIAKEENSDGISLFLIRVIVEGLLLVASVSISGYSQQLATAMH